MRKLLYKWVGDNKIEYAGPFSCQEEIDIFKQVDNGDWIAIEGEFAEGWNDMEDALYEATGFSRTRYYYKYMESWSTDDYFGWEDVIVLSFLPGWTEWVDTSKDYERFYHFADDLDAIKALVPYNDALNLVWRRHRGLSWDKYEAMLALPKTCPDADALVSRVEDIDSLCEAGFPFVDLVENLDAVDLFIAASPAVQQVLADALDNNLADVESLMLNQGCWNEWAEMIEGGAPIEDVFA